MDTAEPIAADRPLIGECNISKGYGCKSQSGHKMAHASSRLRAVSQKREQVSLRVWR